jgi:hypothetical protein
LPFYFGTADPTELELGGAAEAGRDDGKFYVKNLYPLTRMKAMKDNEDCRIYSQNTV